MSAREHLRWAAYFIALVATFDATLCVGFWFHEWSLVVASLIGAFSSGVSAAQSHRAACEILGINPWPWS